jgi:hypothetical protein
MEKKIKISRETYMSERTRFNIEVKKDGKVE